MFLPIVEGCYFGDSGFKFFLLSLKRNFKYNNDYNIDFSRFGSSGNCHLANDQDF